LDGLKGGVNYDANDRFCLDGQRLIAINGAYGADGTEYRTEKEAFSKIISTAILPFTGSGPPIFQSHEQIRNGHGIRVTTDARIEAQGKTSVRLWALNKTQDTKGNFLTVSYFKDTGATGTGEYSPTRIDYTGNANSVPSTYSSVQFVYEGPRSDSTRVTRAVPSSKPPGA